MARPTKSAATKQSKRLPVRFTPGELDEVRAYAASRGVPAAEWARELLLADARAYGAPT